MPTQRLKPISKPITTAMQKHHVETLTELATKSKIGKMTISRLADPERTWPEYDEIIDRAEALKLSVEDLVYGLTKRKKPS